MLISHPKHVQPIGGLQLTGIDVSSLYSAERDVLIAHLKAARKTQFSDTVVILQQ